ncbi:MAG: pitrilysin family protein, partial [bacterium]
AMMHCTFPEEELIKERKVILEEFNRQVDMPQAKLFDNLNAELYEETPYKYRVIGSSVNIASFSREQILQTYKTYYVPHNMVLVIAGDFNTKKLKKMVREIFTAPRADTKLIIPDLIEPYKKSYDIIISSANIQQTYIMLGFLGPAWDHKDQYALDLLSIILGQGRSSRLNKSLREKKKLVWSIDAYFYTHTGTGLFTISAACDPEKQDAVLEAIQDELDYVKDNPPAEAEIQRAKKIIQANLIYANETYNAQASQLGQYALLNQLTFLKKYMQNIQKAGSVDIMRVFYRYLNRQHKAVSIIVPK